MGRAELREAAAETPGVKAGTRVESKVVAAGMLVGKAVVGILEGPMEGPVEDTAARSCTVGYGRWGTTCTCI